MTIHDRVERYAPLIDISVRSEGDGRTVDAYAAVFDTPQEIRDREGHYLEVIDRHAFDRTIAQRSGSFQFMFNHGKTMYGTPSERFSVPMGTFVEVRADERGLWTSAKVAKTSLGDEILELINDGAIRGYSFSGAFMASTPDRGPHRPSLTGELTTVRRTEIAMREAGPTPFPAYEAAMVTGVRSEAIQLLDGLSTDELAEFIAGLSDASRAELAQVLAVPGMDDDTPPDTGHRVETHKPQRALRRELQLLDLEIT